MPQVTVTINGHAYSVSCDPGQEQRIRELARIIDGRVLGFAEQFPRAGEARLLIMAALVLADEFAEAREELQRGSVGAAPPAAAAEEALTEGIERLAARIEAVAARLESSHI